MTINEYLAVLLAACVLTYAGVLYGPRIAMAWRLWRDPDLRYSLRRAWRAAGRFA